MLLLSYSVMIQPAPTQAGEIQPIGGPSTFQQLLAPHYYEEDINGCSHDLGADC
jgi:hypothetical protein